MNPKLLRLTAGFLAAFVLISYAPALPDLLRGVSFAPALSDLLRGVSFPAVRAGENDALLGSAAALSLGLWLIVRRRQGLEAPVASHSRVGSASVESALRAELRRAVEQGERIPAIARRHHLSQDAVRVAVGRGPSTPAAGAERVSRLRQGPVPALVAAGGAGPRSSQ